MNSSLPHSSTTAGAHCGGSAAARAPLATLHDATTRASGARAASATDGDAPAARPAAPTAATETHAAARPSRLDASTVLGASQAPSWPRLRGARPFGLQHSADAEIGYPAANIYERMRAIESIGRVHNPAAGYLQYRRVLVDWISEIGDRYRLNPTTVHVAVGYLDRFLQHVEVHRQRLQLVALASIMIAAKYEEAEERVPIAERLNAEADGAYSPRLIPQMEVLMLNSLRWSLTVVTPRHILGLYLRMGVVFEDDTMAYKPLQDKQVLRFLRKYMEFFADLCLQVYDFGAYAPTRLAAAILVAARRCLILRPEWNPELRAVTRYSEDDLAPVVAHLWVHYTASYPAEAAVQEAQGRAADQQALADGLVTALPQAHGAALSGSGGGGRAASAARVVAAAAPPPAPADDTPPAPRSAAGAVSRGPAAPRDAGAGASDSAASAPASAASSVAAGGLSTAASVAAAGSPPVAEPSASAAAPAAAARSGRGAAPAAAPAGSTRVLLVASTPDDGGAASAAAAAAAAGKPDGAGTPGAGPGQRLFVSPGDVTGAV